MAGALQLHCTARGSSQRWPQQQSADNPQQVHNENIKILQLFSSVWRTCWRLLEIIVERRVERAGHNMRLLRTVLLNTSRATFRQNLGFERVLPDEVETKEREAIIEFF